MTENPSRRSLLTSGAAAMAAVAASTAAASTVTPAAGADAPAVSFEPERVVAQIAAIEDYDEQLALLKRFSALMRKRFSWMLVRDYDVQHAIEVLQAHQDPKHSYHFGDLPDYTRTAEIDLREALTGQELSPRILRVNIDLGDAV